MSAEPNREMLIFTEALRLPPEARSDYVERACTGDENQRRKVHALLRANDRAGRFMEELPSAFADERVQQAGTIEKPGDWIGRYQLLRQIGEGGWGVVFLAEQKEPVHRRVALKVIKPGMDTKSVIARFEAERQALALMDHPHIAHVLDAGATQTGRPFFVMELVRGIKITEYCDQNSLTTSERLELFIKVCGAIQHAHQKGIVHRDIKPSNILVDAASGGEAFPKVIDFGIVKATTNDRLSDKTFLTAKEVLIGTPAYMSPEQAAHMDVDTRADIYSLGVLLYELLTGTTPFNSRTLLGKGLDEIRRVISSEEPLRPSARLKATAAADLQSLAQRRGVDQVKLVREVRGDLDWIVLKALEKDRARRYATAHGLAMDVQRCLSNETVVARPPSRLYKFRKLVVRHKLAFAGVTLVTLFLIAGLIVVSSALATERKALRQAQSEADKSRQVTAILVESVQDIDPSIALGQDNAMLRGILEGATRRLDTGLTNQPEVQADLLATIGRVYRQIGIYERAEAMDRAALAIYRRLSPSDNPQTASTLNELGLALISRAKLPEAEGAEKESLAIARRLIGDASPQAATALHDLAHVYMDEGKYAEAESLSRQSLVIRQRWFDPESLQVADSLRNLTVVLGDQGKWAEAEETARKVLAIRRKWLDPKHPTVASALQDLAWVEGARGKLVEAQALERELLELRAKVLPEGHPEVATSLYLLGDRLRQRGDLEDACAVLNSAVSMQQQNKDSAALLNTLHSLGLTLEGEGKLSDTETVFRRRFDLWREVSERGIPRASSEAQDLSRVLGNEGKLADAENVQQESMAIRRHLYGDESAEVAASMNDLAHAYADEKKYAQAESLCRQSLALWRKLVNPEGSDVADSLRNLTLILGGQGKWAEAEETAHEVLAIRRRIGGPDDPLVASALQDLVWVEVNGGKLAEGQASAREVLEMRGRVHAERHSDVASSLYSLGECLRQRGNLEDANAVLSTALSILQTEFGEDQPDTPYALRSLGWAQEAEGKLPEAEKTFRHGLALWQKHGTRGLPEQEGLARVLIAEHKFHEAEQFLDQILLPEARKDSSNVDLLNLRVTLLSRQGRFREAIADATLVAKYKPSSLDYYHPLAGLLAVTDDQPAYSNTCQKTLMMFTNVTSGYQAMCMALNCLVLTDSGVDPAVADKLADKALTLGKNDGSMPDFQACKALSEYRLGHFAEAIEWGQKPLKSYSDYARGKAYSVLAMAQWRLGHKEVARAMLSVAKKNVPDVLKASPPDLGPEWRSWLIAWIHLKEATKLVEPDLRADNSLPGQ